jgi:hypothetical protein
MLGGPTVKQLRELAGQQHSIRAIAGEVSLSRNTVRKYLRAPGIPRYTPRVPRPSSWTPIGTTFGIGSPPVWRMPSCCCASCVRRATRAATRS